MIDPTAVSTIRVGELSPEPFSLTDNVPHEVGTELKRGTIEDLATFISAFIGSTDGVGFRAISVTDGQTLPTTTQQEFILVGKGTYYNVVGGSTIICTEELNAIVSNGSYWFIGVEIPINVELAGITQFIRDGFINTTPSEDVVHEALALKANVADSEDVTNKISGITGYSTTLYPNEKATHDALDLKLNISDLPTNLTLYPTTTTSDVSGYVVMVKDIHDVRYNSTAVDVSTPTITGVGQLISQRISDAGVLIGQPGVFNITTFGNIRHLSGSGSATFYFEVYHRDLAGVETLICTSSTSEPVVDGGYSEFTASGLWDDGDFVATDRIVIKSYANRIAGGSDPVYQFQFGGASPVRTLLPVPFSVVDAGYELKSNKQNDLTPDGTGAKYPTVDAVNALKWIKSNESLSFAQRKGDILYGILDQYTGEEITLSKVTGTPTADGVIYFQLGSEYFIRNFNKIDVKWFGAKGDEITEDYSAIQNALNSGFNILFTKGNYLISTPLSYTSNNSLSVKFEKGAKILANLSTASYVLTLSGTGTSLYTTTLSAGAIRGDYSITVASSTGYVVGDFIKIKDETALWKYDPRAGVYPGELNEIVGISGNVIKLKKPIKYTYNITVSTVEKREVKKGLEIDGLNIECINSNNFYGVLANYCENLSITNSVLKKTRLTGCSISNSQNVVFNNNTIDDIVFTGTTTSYGASISDCRSVLLSNNLINNTRGGIDITGGSIPSWEILIDNNILTNPIETANERCVGTHGSAGDVVISNNSIYGGVSGILLRGYKIEVLNNTIKSCLTYGINAVNGSDFIFSNNNIEMKVGLTIQVSTIENTIANYVIIRDNVLKSDGSIGMKFRDYGNAITYYSVDFSNNIIDATTYGFYLETGTISNLNFVNNKSKAGQIYRIDGTVTSFFLNHPYPLSTTQRPVSPVDGSTYYDTTLNRPCWYDSGNATWVVVAPLVSPTFTGTPTAPTATVGTNTTQIATTAFAQGIRPYKVYTALLTQVGTGAPTAIILENTIGAIVWSRTTIGGYFATLSGAFTTDKTSVLITNGSANSTYIHGSQVSTSNVNVITVADGQIDKATVEIRVYN